MSEPRDESAYGLTDNEWAWIEPMLRAGANKSATKDALRGSSPGVLLDWRRTRQGQWEALVVHATGGGNHDVTVTSQWVPAAHVPPRRVSLGARSWVGDARGEWERNAGGWSSTPLPYVLTRT